VHELYLMCDDVEALIAEMGQRGDVPSLAKMHYFVAIQSATSTFRWSGPRLGSTTRIF
jgi:hypothetical protein